MNVTVCVIFRNSEKTILDLIHSFKYLPYSTHHFNFIFVDNNSSDRSNSIVQNSGLNNCKIIFRNTNSLADARNQAIENCRTDYIYFIDSDCSLNKETWSELLKYWNPDLYMGCGGSQIFPDSIPFLKVLDQMRTSYLGHFGSAQMQIGSSPMQVDHLSTTHVLYQKNRLEQLGGFDSRLNLSAEDLELSLRAQENDYKLLFIPSSQVNHTLCRNLKGWIKKAWRNGLWQTRLVAINFKIIKTRRFWPSLFLFAFLIISPKYYFIFLLFYFVGILIICLKNKKLSHLERMQLFILFIMTHGIYFTSGLFGLVLACHDFIRSTFEPKKTPS